MLSTMKDKGILILSTRPLDTSLVEKAAYNNIVIETISFIQIESEVSEEVGRRIETLAEKRATVVFTSTNAVEIVVDRLPVRPLMPEWKIYCIGGATFTHVKKYWPYDSVAYTGKNATELAEKIISDGTGEVVFFCGNQRREELPALLAQRKITVEELVVYRTIETAKKVSNNYTGILFFSPSAVHSYFSLNRADDRATFFALGQTTANAIKLFTTNTIIVSDFPAKDQLVEKVINYYNDWVNMNGFDVV